jgi:hypothetical protein
MTEHWSIRSDLSQIVYVRCPPYKGNTMRAAHGERS